MFEEIKPLQLSRSDVNIWFTSDLHFGHENIIKFCNRPWRTTEEMDEALIYNWNSLITKDDIVFNLGDFAFASKKRWKELISRLNGKQYLIVGNHDISRYPGDDVMSLFEGVYSQLLLKIDNKKIYLSHMPLLCYDGYYKPINNTTWGLSGHVHIQKSNNTGLDFERLRYMLPTQYDVDVDFNDYAPVSFEEVSAKINFQLKNNTNIIHWVKH